MPEIMIDVSWADYKEIERYAEIWNLSMEEAISEGLFRYFDLQDDFERIEQGNN